MSAAFKNQARCLNKMIDARDETQAHMYLEQLLLLPVDVQDKIIEDINNSSNCDNDCVADIIGRYSMLDMR